MRKDSTSFLSRFFGSAVHGESREQAKRPRRRSAQRLRFEGLERREVFSASFGSAMSIGADELRGSIVTDVATDQAGNRFMTGSFAGTFDFDPGDGVALRTARGSGDIFVAKYGADGALSWVQQMGGDAAASGPTDRAQSLALGANGAVYVSGQFLGTTEIGNSTFVAAGGHDAFVAKLNAGGAIQWARRAGSTDTEVGWSVDVDAADNVYLLTSNTSINVSKFKSNGAPVWTKSIVNYPLFSGMSTEANLAVDASGNVFVAGQFNGTVDFDPSNKQKLVSSGPSSAGFALQLNTQGAFKWVTPFVGRTVSGVSGYSSATQIALDGGGNVIVGGWYGGSVDFNPSSATTLLATAGGGYITKLNSSGDLLWAKALEKNGGTTSLTGFDTDASGNIYAIGYYSGTVDLDPGVGVQSRTSANTDGFVLKLTSAGALDWAVTYGSTAGDVPLGISVDGLGDVHVVGYFTGAVDFDPDPISTAILSSGPQTQGFWWRLRQQ